MRISNFLKDEAEMLEVNYETLQDEMDKATSETERARIAKIVAKQKAIASRLASMGDMIYKDNLMASNDARDDVKRDAALNIDNMIDDIDRENSGKETRDHYDRNPDPDPLSPETITKPEVQKPSSQPLVLF
jgi:crotonobetainyl-CoA:carnitine CoA-transferase CaiB-like acyl-CoA transferase